MITIPGATDRGGSHVAETQNSAEPSFDEFANSIPAPVPVP